jgi:hypothetical protein
MTRQDILEFRRKMAERLITLQNETLLVHDRASVVSNMIAGLLSLASFIARKVAHMTRSDLERVCETAIDERYTRDVGRFDKWAS